MSILICENSVCKLFYHNWPLIKPKNILFRSLLSMTFKYCLRFVVIFKIKGRYKTVQC